MGPSWSMVKFHSILRSHPGAIFRFFVGLKKMGFSDRIQRQKWFFHPPPKIMDDILEFPSTIEKQVLDSCCFIHRCFEASWCFFFEKTFNVSFFLCFRFFCFSSLPRLEQKNNHMFFFSGGSVDFLRRIRIPPRVSSGHRPDPDALDLDEIVEDMLLEEEAEAWRVSEPGDAMMRFGWRFGVIFFVGRYIFLEQWIPCKIWYLYIMFTFIVSGL